MKLFAAIYDDARLLGHFLGHYAARGITEFYIAVAPGFAEPVRQFQPHFSITICEGLDVADSWFGGSSAVSAMRRAHQREHEWAVIVDLDEFLEFAPDIAGVVAAAEREDANVVHGIMYDRFSADGTLIDFAPDSELARLYPVKTRFTRDVMHGNDVKCVLVKGLLQPMPHSGHHKFQGERVFSAKLEIAHYKWNSRALERVEAACRMLRDAGVPWWVEYQRVLDHYARHRRFAWEEFGGELTAPLADTAVGDEPATSAAVPSDAELQQTLLRKARLESAMRAAPDNAILRRSYLELLGRLCRYHLGSFHAILPEIAAPIAIRGGSRDMAELTAAFAPEERLDLLCGAGDVAGAVRAPLRILELGAGAGFAAISLANRFPDAEILAVERPGGGFAALRANTAGYAKIACLPAVLWTEPVRLDAIEDGERGPTFVPAPEPRAGRSIPGHTLDDILRAQGWDGADLISCSLASGQAAAFGGPARPWLGRLQRIVARPAQGAWRLEDEHALRDAFCEPDFRAEPRGRALVFTKTRAGDAETAAQPQPLRLIPPAPHRRPIAARGIIDPVLVFEGEEAAIRLTPNPPAAIAFRLCFGGHACFRVRLAAEPAASAGSIAVKLRIIEALTGRLQAEADRVIAAGPPADWTVGFAPLSGDHDLFLSAATSGGGEDLSAVLLLDAQVL